MDGDSEALTNLERRSLPVWRAATGHSIAFGQLTVAVHADRTVEVVKFLRDDAGCRLRQLHRRDGGGLSRPREALDVVYHLLSPTLTERIRLRAEAAKPPGDSIIEVFPVPTGSSANATTSTA